VSFPETLACGLDTPKTKGVQFIVRGGNDGEGDRGVALSSSISW
jgi:hypothetical protein